MGHDLRGKEEIMTKREMYEVVAAGQINEEVIALAAEELEKLDKRNRKAAEKRAEKLKEDEPMLASIYEMFTDEPLTATDIAAALEISVQKASSLARKLVTAEKAESMDVKGPKGKCKGYVRA